MLPASLQREIRYAIHRHAKTARRTQWRPVDLQKIVDILADTGVHSLTDPLVMELAGNYKRSSMERRILLDLPVAARSLIVTEELAKAAGWFDPIIVGAAPFTGTQGGTHRRKPWDLTAVSQRWLRDLLWDYLRDEALKPKGKRPCKTTVLHRISSVAVLSYILRQIRDDHGNDVTLIDGDDAKAVKEIWDIWFREQIPLPFGYGETSRQPSTLNERSRYVHMANIRNLLRHSREKQRTPRNLDLFSLNLPDYSRPQKTARPRPLTYSDFKLLISPDNITLLEAADREDVGHADIWLTQAFQGGRISETIRLRLGCVGLVGHAQPYIWRDISKVNVVDYGMPCYLPVYERLLRRQENTRAKLRQRYAEELARLDARGQAALEAQWDREMPLFPGPLRIPTWCWKSRNPVPRSLDCVVRKPWAEGDYHSSDPSNAGHVAVEQRRARGAGPTATGPLLPGVAGALCELQQRQHDPASAAGVDGRAGHGQARHHPAASGRCEIRRPLRGGGADRSDGGARRARTVPLRACGRWRALPVRQELQRRTGRAVRAFRAHRRRLVLLGTQT